MQKANLLALAVLTLAASACRAGNGLAELPSQDPRFASLRHCAYAIALGEGFHVSTAYGTALERTIGDVTSELKELLWLGAERAGDSLRAVAHVQLTSSGAKRSTFDQLTPTSQRVVQRINSECSVGPERP